VNEHARQLLLPFKKVLTEKTSNEHNASLELSCIHRIHDIPSTIVCT
ncbi:hypothetical protein THOM_2101, partial [Trachipleistophora hominis]